MNNISMDPKERIVSIVAEHWASFNKTMLLSALGSILDHDTLNHAKITSGTLRKFIQNELATDLRIVPLPVQGDGVVPRAPTKSMSESHLQLLAPHSGSAGSTAGVARKPTYYESVWTSFSEPLAETRRFLEIGRDHVSRHEIGENDEAHASWIEVFSDDLPDFENDEILPPKKIAEAIRSWAIRQGINTSELRPPADKVQATYSSTSKAQPVSGGKASLRKESADALVNFLNTLEPPELRLFNISGDLLLSVLKRAS